MQDAEHEPDFQMPSGTPFARVLETAEGQILASIEPNSDGNASLALRRWTATGFMELRVGVAGQRSPGTDEVFAASLDQLTEERVVAAWHRALPPEKPTKKPRRPKARSGGRGSGLG